MKTVALQADVLIIGGGSAGMWAARRLKERNPALDVLIADKGGVKWGGLMRMSGGDFEAVLPGEDVNDWVRDLTYYWDGLCEQDVVADLFSRAHDRLEDYHRMGCDSLTDENGRIIGALALDISKDEPALKLFRCKAIISACGSTNRIYSSCTPAWMFNVAGCPADCGGGLGSAYRVGCTLVNLDIPGMPAGPKYFSRAGKGTWIGVLRDIDGNNIGPYVDVPSREHGDITSDVWPGVFRDKMKTGDGPVYIDCTDISEEEMQYLYWAFTCEGDTSLVDAMNKQGIDLRSKMVEFGSYECTLLGRGIQIDENAATNVPGLYAVGDQVGNFLSHISGAATMGRIAGEAAASYAAQTAYADPASVTGHATVRDRQAVYSAMLEREEGASWKELNILVNQLMDDYCPVFEVRSESKFRAGAGYFRDLREYSRDALKCGNAHELMRACEALDLMDIGEAVLRSAQERRETRGNHIRPDFPFTNPLLANHFVMITKTEDGAAVEIRPARKK